MRTIAFDAHMIGSQETGNETYAAALATALAHLGAYHYRLYTPRPAALPSALRTAPGVSVHAFRALPAPLRIPLLYPLLVRQDHAALLHLQYVAPPRIGCPVVLTVHDVSFRRFPQFFSPWVRFAVAPLIGPSMRRAARVITISECSRQDILHFYRLPPEQVVVTPLAAGPEYQPAPPGELARVRAAHCLPDRYVLAVGNLQPRKNLARLVAAFARLAADFAAVDLVIVGASAWQ
ncbi:MAG TPA: glycosyltransferase, partial [Chloroflexia bacterium]|nr:glycosyltransferase [Chloroflexia bacterium]